MFGEGKKMIGMKPMVEDFQDFYKYHLLNF